MHNFEDAYARYEQTVYRFLLRLGGNASLAEEMTQETFYQAMRNWKSFRGQSSMSTWLCGIAKRLYFSYCRNPSPLPAEIAPEAIHPDFSESILSRERHMTAHRLLHSLQEPYKEVFMLRTFGELTHAEIGALFGRTENWARVTYYRARQLLVYMAKEECIDE